MAKSRYNSKADRAMKQRFERAQKKRAERRRIETPEFELPPEAFAAIEPLNTEAQDPWFEDFELLYKVPSEDGLRLVRARDFVDKILNHGGPSDISYVFRAIRDALIGCNARAGCRQSDPEEPDLEVSDSSELDGFLGSFGCNGVREVELRFR